MCRCDDLVYASRGHNHPYTTAQTVSQLISDSLVDYIDQDQLDAAVVNIFDLIGTVIDGRCTLHAPSYTAPTLLNGWENFGGGLSTIGYCRFAGRVWLKGTLKSGTLNTDIFQLPSNCYPSEIQSLAAMVGYPLQANQLRIFTDGRLQLTTGPLSILYLDGLSFPAQDVTPP